MIFCHPFMVILRIVMDSLLLDLPHIALILWYIMVSCQSPFCLHGHSLKGIAITHLAGALQSGLPEDPAAYHWVPGRWCHVMFTGAPWGLPMGYWSSFSHHFPHECGHKWSFKCHVNPHEMGCIMLYPHVSPIFGQIQRSSAGTWQLQHRTSAGDSPALRNMISTPSAWRNVMSSGETWPTAGVYVVHHISS